MNGPLPSPSAYQLAPWPKYALRLSGDDYPALYVQVCGQDRYQFTTSIERATHLSAPSAEAERLTLESLDAPKPGKYELVEIASELVRTCPEIAEADEPALITCEEPGCGATFYYVAGRTTPMLCIGHGPTS